MSKVHAVLLVPEPGDPHGLLKEGPCGARPPTVEVHESRCECPTHRWAGSFRRCSVCHIASGQRIGRALVLAWDGKPVAEGLFRLAMQWDARGITPWPETPQGIANMLDTRSDLALGTLVLLDAEGREAAP